jgi:hypothetical protein
MVLRRLTRHLENQNWTAVWIDLLTDEVLGFHGLPTSERQHDEANQVGESPKGDPSQRNCCAIMPRLARSPLMQTICQSAAS